MCEGIVRVSEIAILVGLIGKVVSICSSEVWTVIRQLKPLMQLLLRQKEVEQK